MATYAPMKRITNEDGTISVIEGGPIEPPPPDPNANRITYPEILTRFGWTDDDFTAAQAYGFPAQVGYRLVGFVNQRRINIYARSSINTWIERTKAFVAKAPRTPLK